MKNNDDIWLICARDKMRISEKRGTVQFTDFCERTKAAAFGYGRMWGGYEQAERVMTGFFPDYCDTNFPISELEVSYNANFSRKLTHRDFLGSIIGLGTAREKIGDIIVYDGRAVVFVCTDIADYIITNLESVGRTKVKVRLTDEIPDTESGGRRLRTTVSSLRLDNILSSGFNISRSKTAELIKGGKAFINHIEEKNPSKRINTQDIITLRGFGRIKLLNIEGKTKKDKFSVDICIYG